MGFMGAGKSTVGPLLAHALDWEFIDADQHIVNGTGSTIPQIFGREGESGFRLVEAQAIAELVSRSGHVVALGGGALEAVSTRQLIEATPDTCVVFLDAPLETLLLRCQAADALPTRPLLAELLKDKALLEQRLAARLPFYRRSHLTVSTLGLAPAMVAERILAALGSLCSGGCAAKSGA